MHAYNGDSHLVQEGFTKTITVLISLIGTYKSRMVISVH